MENILQILRERFLGLLAGFDTGYRRYFFNKINTSDRLIGIVGARGIGKTTFLLQYLKSVDIPLTKKLYISADSIELTDISLFELASYFQSTGGELLVIDEIHKYPEFELHLKQIYDFLKIKVIFSGSSALKIENAKVDLSRRAVLYRLNGLSFREFLELKTGQSFKPVTLDDIMEHHVDISYEIISRVRPLEYFREYIQKGYYPFYFENPDTYFIKLEQVINTVLESDLNLIFKIEPENIFKLKKIVKLICTSPPYELNISKLAKKVEINRHTLYKYLDYLHRGEVLYILKPVQKGDKIFSKPEKVYMNNTNLNFCYCGTQDTGTVRETFAVSMLREGNTIEYPKKGDLVVFGKYVFEIGGKNKDFSQIKDTGNSYLFVDNIETGTGRKIPLWLLGFLY
ncbi:ATP-binding protein [Persephonella sp.]